MCCDKRALILIGKGELTNATPHPNCEIKLIARSATPAFSPKIFAVSVPMGWPSGFAMSASMSVAQSASEIR